MKRKRSRFKSNGGVAYNRYTDHKTHTYETSSDQTWYIVQLLIDNGHSTGWYKHGNACKTLEDARELLQDAIDKYPVGNEYHRGAYDYWYLDVRIIRQRELIKSHTEITVI